MAQPFAAICVCAPLLLALPAAAGVSFQKIADKDSPGATWGENVLFSEPTIHAGEVAFRAWGATDGIYVGSGGPVTRIADHTTPIPGSGDTFLGFRHTPDVADAGVVFMGLGPLGFPGIYLATPKGIETVADPSTPPLPGGGTAAIDDAPPRIGGDVVTFSGHPGVYPNLYRYQQGQLEIIADENTSLPGGSGVFGFSPPVPHDVGTLALRAWQASATGPVSGMWRMTGGSFAPVLMIGDPLPPELTEAATYLQAPALRNGTVAFEAGGATSAGIYVQRAGVLERIVARGTGMPGSAETFHVFGPVSADGDSVVFSGSSATALTSGIYAWRDGELLKVVASGDAIDAKTIAQVYVSGNALSGAQVAFRVWFSDFSFAVYRATLPEPPARVPAVPPGLAWLLALALVGAGSRRLSGRGAARSARV